MKPQISPNLLVSFNYTRNKKKNASTRQIKLTRVSNRQMPIKAGWRDASLALWDFSRSNKHCIHLSTKTVFFSRSVSAMSSFAPIEISYSNTICIDWQRKREYIQLLSMVENGGGRLDCHMYFHQNSHFLHYKCEIHRIFSIVFTGSKFHET